MSDKDHTLPDFSATQIVTNALLVSTYYASERIDSFSSWLLVGFAAACAIIISNLGELAEILTLSTIQAFFAYFVVAAILVVLQKYISVLVGAALRASESVAAKLEKMDAALLEKFDWAEFRREVLSASFWPARWIIGRVFDKMESGDLTFSSRRMCRLIQIQSAFVLLQAALHVVSVWVFAKALAS